MLGKPKWIDHPTSTFLFELQQWFWHSCHEEVVMWGAGGKGDTAYRWRHVTHRAGDPAAVQAKGQSSVAYRPPARSPEWGKTPSCPFKALYSHSPDYSSASDHMSVCLSFSVCVSSSQWCVCVSLSVFVCLVCVFLSVFFSLLVWMFLSLSVCVSLYVYVPQYVGCHCLSVWDRKSVV